MNFNSKKIIINSSCFIYKNKTKRDIETEAIFGETFIVKKFEKEWAYGFLKNDNYFGWIMIENLGEYFDTNFKILSKWTFIYETPNAKSKKYMILYLNSLIHVIDKVNDWSKVLFIKNKTKCIGYVFSENLTNKENTTSWILTAKSLLGSPYLWGGKTPLGLDCSALIQLSYASNNIMIPRNSIDQFKISEKLKFSEDNFTTGNLMYWKGHIGIILNRKKFLHSNGFHMKVEEENISNVIKRLGQASIIKIKS